MNEAIRNKIEEAAKKYLAPNARIRFIDGATYGYELGVEESAARIAELEERRYFNPKYIIHLQELNRSLQSQLDSAKEAGFMTAVDALRPFNFSLKQSMDYLIEHKQKLIGGVGE